MRDKLREALGKWKCERCHGAGVVHTHPPAWNEPPVKCFQCDGDGMHPIARAALSDTERRRQHKWRAPEAGEPMEEGGVCEVCGAFANSEADKPCVPLPSAGLVRRLRELAALEPGWYANVGRKTGEACCAAMREAADAIESADTAGEWRTIESAPKDGLYIVTNRLGEVCPCRCRDGQRVIENMPGFADWTWPEAATGWRPLPAPPASPKKS